MTDDEIQIELAWLPQHQQDMTTEIWELLSNLVEIPFQANCRSVRRSRHPVDLAML